MNFSTTIKALSIVLLAITSQVAWANTTNANNEVVGMVDGGPRVSLGQKLVRERRPIEGRVVHVLDPGVLVARAERIMAKVEGLAA